MDILESVDNFREGFRRGYFHRILELRSSKKKLKEESRVSESAQKS